MSDKKGILFHVSENQHKVINEAAQTLGIARSEMIRAALTEYLKNHDIELPQDLNPHGYRKDYKDFSADE